MNRLQQQNAELKANAKVRANCIECSRMRSDAQAQLKQFENVQNENDELKVKNRQLLTTQSGLRDELYRLQKQLATAQDDASGYRRESHKLRSELSKLTTVPLQRPVRTPPPSVEEPEQTVRIPSPRLDREPLLAARPRERKAISAIDLVDDEPKGYRLIVDRPKALTVSGTGATRFGSDSRIAKNFRGQHHASVNGRFLSTRNSHPGISRNRKRQSFHRRFETSMMEDGSLRNWRRNDRLERRK